MDAAKNMEKLSLDATCCGESNGERIKAIELCGAKIRPWEDTLENWKTFGSLKICGIWSKKKREDSKSINKHK